jgi:hypothetical protein
LFLIGNIQWFHVPIKLKVTDLAYLINFWMIDTNYALSGIFRGGPVFGDLRNDIAIAVDRNDF